MMHLLALWSIIGVISLAAIPKYKIEKWMGDSRVKGITCLLLFGPLCWILFLIATIDLFVLPPSTTHKE